MRPLGTTPMGRREIFSMCGDYGSSSVTVARRRSIKTSQKRVTGSRDCGPEKPRSGVLDPSSETYRFKLRPSSRTIIIESSRVQRMLREASQVAPELFCT
ncbi:hypothetical protein Zmor_002051 [Zophobas morio]|uniref:Uncharacterized protein n=1 Tax=Zophobas morio TaxID=2755281 RepID=A0AA38J427_9CUCU|nr:hypothetical protein Zmor_002051 [Zophobas morio]